ncbi:MAG: hypothetical protein CVU43_12540 [Chloroflexi bacterium HGW-Chloroflexi-5]|jgi:hypothetical protein|nr:MAG: hypothetical protein CVU43_12540 [Chloroflexi bacterium HGW-Chloroflexi-5]PKP09836.1 MAG: hypothetical protein CVU09_09410 [Bacteroidetes bacterium HGW-Bacteroidetes-4]
MPGLQQNIICVTVPELASIGVSENYLKKALSQHRQGVVSCWPHHKEGRTIYIHYAGLKTEYQQSIKEKLCQGMEPADWIKTAHENNRANEKEAKAEALELAVLEAINNYHGFTRYYDGFKPEQKEKTAKNASAIVAAANYMKANNIKPNSLTFYNELGLIFDKYGQKPSNARRLAEKVKAYFEGTPINEIVTVPRAGNNNRALYRQSDAQTLETIRGWMLQLMDGHNYTDAMIVRTLLRNCEIQQFDKIPSQSTLQNWVNARDISFLSANARYGDNSRFSSKFNGITPMARPLHANDVWQMDGTRINMIPHRAVAKNGQKKDMFLYIVAVYDAHSGDYLGEYYGYTESRWAYAAALHAACMNTGALPHTLVLDRFPGHNTKEWLHLVEQLKNRYGVTVIESSKSTGKAQVERSFGTVQSVFMAASELYYGEGVKSTRPSAHRTEEHIQRTLKEAKKAGFELEGAISEAVKVMQAYRHTPLNTYSRKFAKLQASPAQLHAASDKPNQIALEPIDMVRLFYLRNELTFKQQMFSMEVLREPLYYPIDDFKFVKNYTGQKFEVRYDPFNLEQLYIFDLETSAFVRTAKRYTPAIGYGPDADHKPYAKLKAARKAIETTRKVERARMIEEAPGLQRPALPEPDYSDHAEVTALTPHEPKGIKEHAESDFLLKEMGVTPEKDAWEREAERIKIPGID